MTEQLIDTTASRITLQTLCRMRAEKIPIAMLTAYDYPTAVILAEAGIPTLLVGDSAAMAVLGEVSTTGISMDYLVTITRAVRKGAPGVFLLADMPFGSYPDVITAVANAARFLKEAGADAVKLESDSGDIPVVAGLVAAGIPVCAHVGLLPQRAAQRGGYRAQGRTPAEARSIIADALGLRRAGAQMLLIEAVPDEVSRQIHDQVDCPLIGCGAGPSCDGHVMVVNDMLGYGSHIPKFVEKLADIPTIISQAAAAYLQQVQTRQYPAIRHQYHMKQATGPQSP
jgi:3-methyl-2-oxobutanoate hydroxymethyltransferase